MTLTKTKLTITPTCNPVQILRTHLSAKLVGLDLFKTTTRSAKLAQLVEESLNPGKVWCFKHTVPFLKSAYLATKPHPFKYSFVVLPFALNSPTATLSRIWDVDYFFFCILHDVHFKQTKQIKLS